MQLKNFGFKHKSGILLPVSALPNKYGIGSFGKGAFDFVDFLVETGTKCWQVSPLMHSLPMDNCGATPYTAGKPCRMTAINGGRIE